MIENNLFHSILYTKSKKKKKYKLFKQLIKIRESVDKAVQFSSDFIAVTSKLRN